MKISIPVELMKYKDRIEKSIVPVVRIDCKNESVLPWNSKIGGNPYWELTDKDYPRDIENKPMRLLAQINFKEAPNFQHFPKDGLLQFFVSTDEDTYGMDLDDLENQVGFRIIYRKDIVKDLSKLLQDFSFLDVVTFDHFPIAGEQKLEFRIDEEPVSISVNEFDKFFEGIELTKAESDKYFYEINPILEGCKMGGYPDHKQGDVRESDDEILLLQLGYEDGNNVIWGDGGVGSFFIRENDLKNLDFSKVAYNWDCY